MRKFILVGILFLVAGFGFVGSVWAEVGVTDNEIVIGTQLDLSGPIVSVSLNVKDGMQMKLREINDAGGIHGRKIKLIIGDHGYDPKKAIMLTNKQITRDKVFCFVGMLGTHTFLASLPIIERKKIPALFSTALIRKTYNPPRKYVYQLFPSHFEASCALATYFAREKKMKRIGRAVSLRPEKDERRRGE